MIKMKIAADNVALSELQTQLAKLAKLGRGSMPSTASAMSAGASFIKGKWREFALGGDLDGVKKLNNPSQGYARSIKIKKLSPFNYDIYSESSIAERIEDGTAEHDMKTTHPFGRRSRVSKDGSSAYLIIPFRWRTPKTVGFKNVMPINVYMIVKKFKKMATEVSTDSGEKTPIAKGAYSDLSTKKAVYPNSVGRASYNRGYGRLAAHLAEEKNQVGMVRSTDDTGKNRSGGYFTFRVISTKSPASSWIRKEQPPRPVTPALVNYSQRFIEEAVEAAIMGDLGL
jgi:hypothetical protein